MYTVDNFILGLQKLWPNLSIVQDNDCIKLIQQVYHGFDQETPEDEVAVEITIAELNTAIESIPDSWNIKEQFVYNEGFCEVFIQPERARGPAHRNWDREYHAVHNNNYSFYISKASLQYSVALICACATNDDINITSLFPPKPYFYREHSNSLDDLLQSLRWITVKVNTPVRVSLSEFRRMIHSYLFNVCYNTGLIYSIPEAHSSRQPARRSTRREGQLFPYKQYNQSLVKYYYQGLSSDIPFAQYLAFYHVPEYYFQAVAEDDAFKEIEDFITHPAFSPRKKEDMRRFYNKVRKIMYLQKENDVWDEKVGFLLCLKKYIPDLDVLKSTIIAIDASALDYYKSTEVPFANDGCKINFDATPENIYATIRNRVYSVRNSIVHSKEGERLRYEPFRHDKDLSKEIPLIRAIAEEIIINSSKPIDIRITTDN